MEGKRLCVTVAVLIFCSILMPYNEDVYANQNAYVYFWGFVSVSNRIIYIFNALFFHSHSNTPSLH